MASGVLAFLGSPNHGSSKLIPKNTPHFSSNQTGSPVQPAAHPLLIFFPSSAGFRGVPVLLAFLFDSISFSTCHIEPTHSTLSPHRAQHAKHNICTTSQLLYPCVDPLEPCALLV